MKKVTTVLAVLMLSSSFFVGAQNIGDLNKHKEQAESMATEKTAEVKSEVEKVKKKGKGKVNAEEWKAKKSEFKKERAAYKEKKVAMRTDVKGLREILKAEKAGTSTLSEAESKAKKIALADGIEKQRDELKSSLKFKEDHLASLKSRVAKAETRINESAATDSEEVKAAKQGKLAKAKEHVAKFEANLKKENLKLDKLTNLIAKARK